MSKAPAKNPAAVALGRLGGQVKSERKAAAARKNGQKGGWPKGKKRKEHEAGVERMAARIRAAVEHAKRERLAGREPKVERTIITIDAKPKGIPRKGKKGKA